jgi:hypothetical protein
MICGMAEGISTFHGFKQGRGRRGYSQMRHADRRRQHEDHGRDQSWHHADAEKHDGWNEIDEGWQCLHQVQDGLQDMIETRPVRRRDADRHTDGHADHAGRNDQGQALGRPFPVVLVENEEHAQQRQQACCPAALQPPGNGDENGDDHERMGRLQQP